MHESVADEPSGLLTRGMWPHIRQMSSSLPLPGSTSDYDLCARDSAYLKSCLGIVNSLPLS